MKTIKKISVLTNVLITALIIKDEFYLTNALLPPGLKILISLSFFLWYIIIAASDVLIEVSSWLWRPGTRSMIHDVMVARGEGVLWALSNETPSICFHMKARGVMTRVVHLRSQERSAKIQDCIFPLCHFFNFLNFTQNGQGTHFSSWRSHKHHRSCWKRLCETVLPGGNKLGRSAYGCVIGTPCIVHASELDRVTASIAHHHPQLQATNSSDTDSRSSQVIALHSFSPKSPLLYDEVLH